MSEPAATPETGIELRQYPDPVRRETYPPLPRRGGNPNAVDTAGVIMQLTGQVGKRLPPAVAQAIATTIVPVAIPDSLVHDPEVEQLQAAGWL